MDDTNKNTIIATINDPNTSIITKPELLELIKSIEKVIGLIERVKELEKSKPKNFQELTKVRRTLNDANSIKKLFSNSGKNNPFRDTGLTYQDFIDKEGGADGFVELIKQTNKTMRPRSASVPNLKSSNTPVGRPESAPVTKVNTEAKPVGNTGKKPVVEQNPEEKPVKNSEEKPGANENNNVINYLTNREYTDSIKKNNTKKGMGNNGKNNENEKATTPDATVDPAAVANANAAVKTDAVKTDAVKTEEKKKAVADAPEANATTAAKTAKADATAPVKTAKAETGTVAAPDGTGAEAAEAAIKKIISDIKQLVPDGADNTLYNNIPLDNIKETFCAAASKTISLETEDKAKETLGKLTSYLNNKVVTQKIKNDIVSGLKEKQEPYNNIDNIDNIDSKRRYKLYGNLIKGIENIKQTQEVAEIKNLKDLNDLYKNNIQEKINAVMPQLFSLVIENYKDNNDDKLEAGDMDPRLARAIMSNIARFAPNIQDKLKKEFIKIDEYQNSFSSPLGTDDVNIEIGDENIYEELERKKKKAMYAYANRSDKLNALIDEYAREVVSRPIRNKLDQKDLDNARQDAMQDIAQNNIALEVNLAKIDQDKQYALVAAFSDAKYSLLNQEIDDITSRIQLSQEAEKMLRDTNKESLQLHLKRNLKELLNKEKNLEELELKNKKHINDIETLTEDIQEIKDQHKVNGMTALTKVVLFLLSLTGVGLIFTLPYIVGHRLSRDSELEKKILPLQNKIRRMDEKKKDNEAKIEQLKKDLDNPLPFYQNNSRAVAQHNDQAGIHSPEAKVQTTKLTRELELVTASISGKVSNIKNMDNNIKVMQSVAPTDNKNLSNTKRREY